MPGAATPGAALSSHRTGTTRAGLNRGLVWIWALCCFLMSSVAGAEIYFVHNDHRGAPIAMTDVNKNVVWRAEYDPFGKAKLTVQSKVMNLRLPGQYFDAETGLHYNYYRDYDPATGRYLQSDPIGLGGGANPYLYANANPLKFTDPTGEIAFALPAVPAIAGALGELGSALLGGATLAAIGALPGDTESSDSRSIPKPTEPKCGCTCICRADANDNIPGNIKPGDKTFAFGEATAADCAAASKLAKRNATQALGKQPKHVGCRCSGR